MLRASSLRGPYSTSTFPRNAPHPATKPPTHVRLNTVQQTREPKGRAGSTNQPEHRPPLLSQTEAVKSERRRCWATIDVKGAAKSRGGIRLG
jgi:hypothetical protein